jgi:hypothetical protein
VNTIYSSRAQPNVARPWSGRELAGLVLHWLAVWASILLIIGLFILSHVFTPEAVPILIIAFAVLGIELTACCLWAQMAGWPVVLLAIYGALTMRAYRTVPTPDRPWFDRNGIMLWQRDGRGGWVQKGRSIS